MAGSAGKKSFGALFTAFIFIGILTGETAHAENNLTGYNSVQDSSLITQTIRGTVMDAFTSFPLPGATVSVAGTEPIIGTATDGNGNFTLMDVPLGRQSLHISFIGYETKLIPNILLTSGKEKVLNIMLEEQHVKVEEVVVKAGKDKHESLNDMATVSARTFSVEETERFAGSLGDPARMVANYAGVMTQSDSRNDIIIRGNSPSGVQWKLEGVEIPNPNHFAANGTTGGPVSMLNNNLLSNSDFLTGAFPAEFGNVIAGVFDLNMRSGNNNKTEFTGQIGFNGFEGGIEGPMFKVGNQKASYMANFRYSTMEVLHKLGFSFGTGSAVPEYQDLTFIFDIPGTKLGRFKLFGLWGNSHIALGRDFSDTTANSYNQKGIATTFGSGVTMAGISHTYPINKNSSIKSSVAFQSTTASTVLDSIFPGPPVLDSLFLNSVLTEKKLSFNTRYRHRIDSRNHFSIGGGLDHIWVDFIDSILHPDYGKFVTRTDIEGSMWLARAYTQYKHFFTKRFSGYGGLHFMYFSQNAEFNIEPRMGLRMGTRGGSSFNLGLGMHSQIQPRTVFFDESLDDFGKPEGRTNEDIGNTRAIHLVLGYDHLFNSDFRFKLETFYQYLYKVPVKDNFPEYSLLNTGDMFGIPLEDSLLNKGTGRNYGLELTLEKFLSKGYYFLFTASLFDSKYTGADDIWRNTAFNGNYVFNILGGWEHKLGKRLLLTIDLKGVWAGGRRYIPIDLAASISESREQFNWNMAYENRYGDYLRADLRLGLKMDGKRAWQEWAIDLQNITNHQSIYMEGYDNAKQEIYQSYQMGFMPMFLYRIQF